MDLTTTEQPNRTTQDYEAKINSLVQHLDFMNKKIDSFLDELSKSKKQKSKLLSSMRHDVNTTNGNRLKRLAKAPYASIRNIADNPSNRFLRISTRFIRDYHNFTGPVELYLTDQKFLYLIPEPASISLYGATKLATAKMYYHSVSVGFRLPSDVSLGNFISAYCYIHPGKSLIKVDLTQVICPKTGDVISMWQGYSQMFMGVTV